MAAKKVLAEIAVQTSQEFGKEQLGAGGRQYVGAIQELIKAFQHMEPTEINSVLTKVYQVAGEEINVAKSRMNTLLQKGQVQNQPQDQGAEGTGQVTTNNGQPQVGG